VVEVELLDTFAGREAGGPDPILAAVAITGGDLALHLLDENVDRIRSINRLRGLLVGAFPALERVLDFTNRGPLILISGFQTPTAIRRLGHVRLARWLERRGVRGAARLAHAAAAAASRQTVEISGASAAASLIARLAQAVLELDRQLAGIFRAIQTLPSSPA
jgi:hypothetical protein